MKNCHSRISAVALLLGAGLLASTIEDAGKWNYDGFLSSAHAQPLRKLIARLRGQTLPDGIAKAEGRIEATQVDVSGLGIPSKTGIRPPFGRSETALINPASESTQ